MSKWVAIPEVGERIQRLSVIKGYAQEIQRCLPGEGDAMECARHIERDAHAMMEREAGKLWMILRDDQ